MRRPRPSTTASAPSLDAAGDVTGDAARCSALTSGPISLRIVPGPTRRPATRVPIAVRPAHRRWLATAAATEIAMQRSAGRARAAPIRRAAVGRPFEVGIRHHDQMVLGTAERLHRACRPRRRRCRRRPGDRGRSDEADRGHVRVIEQRIDRDPVAMHDVEHAGRQPGLGEQLGERMAVTGSRSEGFSTKVLPHGDRHGNIHIGTIAGKLNGVMPATTPSGWRSAVESTGPTLPENSPLSSCGMPQANSTTSMPRVSSPRASQHLAVLDANATEPVCTPRAGSKTGPLRPLLPGTQCRRSVAVISRMLIARTSGTKTDVRKTEVRAEGPRLRPARPANARTPAKISPICARLMTSAAG